MSERRYILLKPCMACNREKGHVACDLCCKIENAEREAGTKPSPELRGEDYAERVYGIEYAR